MGSGHGLLAGRGVVITGAGRGLGRAFALAAARAGAGVVVNDIDVDAAAAVVAEIAGEGGLAVPSGASVSSWSESEALIDQCAATFGAIDGLVNNAVAYRHFGPAWEESEAGIREAVDVAVLGTLFCGTHAMHRMLPCARGSIVNITSRAHMGTAGKSTYVAIKGAVASATYAWALELVDAGVRVNALAPYAFTRAQDLAVAAGLATVMSRAVVATPELVAPAVVYLLSDLSSSVTGQVLTMLGGRLGLLAPPHQLRRQHEREQWTPEEIADVVEREFAPHFHPVGFEAAEYRRPRAPDAAPEAFVDTHTS